MGLAAILLATMTVWLIVVAALCLIVYDPSKSSDRPLRERISLCFVDLCSWWTWR